MYTQVNPKPKRPVERTTWYYMSSKHELLEFGLDYPHFVARAGRLRTGIVSDGSYEDMNRIQEQQIATNGTVIEMIDLFDEGAVITFYDPKNAEIAYKRIMNHMKAHQQAMRTDLMYEAPDVEEFRRFAAFAMAIRHIALKSSPNLDAERRPKALHRHMQQVVRFSDALERAKSGGKTSEEEKDKFEELPEPVKKLDAIERYLELVNGS